MPEYMDGAEKQTSSLAPAAPEELMWRYLTHDGQRHHCVDLDWTCFLMDYLGHRSLAPFFNNSFFHFFFTTQTKYTIVSHTHFSLVAIASLLLGSAFQRLRLLPEQLLQLKGSDAVFDLADELPSPTPVSAGPGLPVPSSSSDGILRTDAAQQSQSPPGQLDSPSQQLTSAPTEAGPRRSRRRRRQDLSPERPESSESGQVISTGGAEDSSEIAAAASRRENEILPNKRPRYTLDNMRPDGGPSPSNSNGVAPVSNGASNSLQKSSFSNSKQSQAGYQDSPIANGSSALSPTYLGHSREEVTRILIQSLYELGYHQAASTLTSESRYELESPGVAAFRAAILDGNWNEAERILLSSFCPDGDAGEMDGVNGKQLSKRDGLLMSTPENIRARAGWGHSISESRQHLLSELTKSISPSVMIPDHRLAVLLDQPPSLYSDHLCDKNDFPLRTAFELSHHTNEVWYLEFSHDGTKLATTSRDCTVLIYDSTTFEIIHRLTDHSEPVAYATWSPDDSKLITCSQDFKAKMWNVQTGNCILTIDHHHAPITSASWAPDGESFVTGSLDGQSQLCHWSVHGEALYTWPGQYRVRDCAITPDGRRLIAISLQKKIYVYNFITREEEYSVLLKLDLTCLSISADSRYMLVNMSENEVQLLDIDTADVVRRFLGQKQGNFLIRSAFGGAAENFVVSGSEDAKIYIWHKENSQLVESLEGHVSGCVNAVAWNPTEPGMFASAGDDRKVRM
ncbi:WD domain-containing protein [Arthroderma uncinatum]|uniref:WD domain-containing protein n=1 Tax=Arthroderma uncinatum TaxID=74035 RepID=UPI00144A9268|nr:WD domain-containing protein [Arthroderma uncinatum]KAF3479462.1 WD domain-containing protein [Arthroderma uncinatum]